VKVAHLTTVDLSLRHLLLAQLEAARDAGHEVIGISAPGPDVAFLEARGIRHVPLDASTRSVDLGADVAAARQLWKILRVEQPDVLHTHNPKPGVYGRIVGRLARVPLIVNTVHGLYATADDPLPRRAVVYAAEGVAGRFSHVELYQNPEDLLVARRLRLTNPARARLLGNGVDLARFLPEHVSASERAAIRGDLGFDDAEIVVGIVGRLVAEKGYGELIEAVRRAGPPLRLLAIGPEDPAKPDSLAPALVERARADGAVFLGHRDDVDRLYAAMDVFALPSHREGFPRAAMEAAAMALPIVASDVRGCRQVVDDGATGYLVRPGDAAALAAALERLRDATLRRTLGEAGHRKATTEFDEREVVRIVLESYGHPRRRRRAGS
jgi:glycosyltransferase involved in cell wall biosynthesis